MIRHTLIAEYKRLAAEYAALEMMWGDTALERAHIDAKKLNIAEDAGRVRAEAVNDFLNLMRWAIEDAPGTLEDLLAIVAELAKSKQLKHEVRELVKVELEPVRKAYMDLKSSMRRPAMAGR